MIKLNATAGKVTAGSVIPFTQDFNTNNKYSFSNNSISVQRTGFTEIIGAINVESTAVGNYGINILNNGNVVATYYADSAAIGDVITIPLYELFRVIPTNILNGYAKISFSAVNDLTITGGIVTGKYIN